MAEASDANVAVTAVVDAGPPRLFAILVDPTQHAMLDGSNMIRGAATKEPITKVGDVFIMDMHYDKVGDYQVANHVVEFRQDRKIAWAVAPVDGELLGHRWIWELVPSPGGGTLVTHTYDWSDVKEDGLVKPSAFPLVSADQMTETVRRLGRLV